MALVVGYDYHPASRAAVLFAGELAHAMNTAVHVVHIVDIADSPISGAPISSAGADDKRLTSGRQHVADYLDAAHVQWTYRVLNGNPVTALVDAADECAAMLIVIGRPQHGIGPALGHVVTGAVARNLLRTSSRPVAVVPEFGGNP